MQTYVRHPVRFGLPEELFVEEIEDGRLGYFVEVHDPHIDGAGPVALLLFSAVRVGAGEDRVTETAGLEKDEEMNARIFYEF